jgi:hypothetical protein
VFLGVVERAERKEREGIKKKIKMYDTREPGLATGPVWRCSVGEVFLGEGFGLESVDIAAKVRIVAWLREPRRKLRLALWLTGAKLSAAAKCPGACGRVWLYGGARLGVWRSRLINRGKSDRFHPQNALELAEGVC